MRHLTDLWRGVGQHPWRTAGRAFLCFSALWTITESLDYFFQGIQFRGPAALAMLIASSIVFALQQASRPSKVSFRVANSNTRIVISYGDLFDQNGLKAIAVNNFFDSKLGLLVAPSSLHGQLIARCFGGTGEAFDRQVDDQLAPVAHDVIPRGEGKQKRYPIGTTAAVECTGGKFITFALSETDPETAKASANVTMAWLAMEGLCNRGRIECGGEPLNVPLIGSGLSGIGLPTRDLLNLIVLSVITNTKAKHITVEIRIILGFDRFDDLDLREVKHHWQI